MTGNPTCGDVQAGATALKGDPPKSGTYTVGSVTITLTVDGQNKTIDWTSTVPLGVVIVKGGPNANVYRYDPKSTGDAGLHPPVNPNNGTYYGLSHVTFCEGAGDQPGGGDNPGGGNPPGDTNNQGGTPTPGTPAGTTPAPTGQTPSGTGQTEVLGERVTSGAARLRMTNRCGQRYATVTVRGRAIASVRFTLDGRTAARRKGASKVTYRIDLGRISSGIHKVRAIVTFTKTSGTAPRTLRATVQRCGRQAVLPQFTG